MGLSRTISEMISFEIVNFFHPRVFCVSAEGVPFRIGYRRTGSKHYTDGSTWPNKKFDDIFSRVDTIHQRDGQTWTTANDSNDLAYA